MRAMNSAVFEGDEFALACVDLGQEGGTLIGLSASGAEEGLLQVAGGDLGQLFGQVHEVFRQVDVADMLQGVDLLSDFLVDFRIAVAAVDDGDTCKAVQILLALAVIEVLHGAADELAWLLVEMGQAGHDVFLFLLYDALRAEISFFSHL